MNKKDFCLVLFVFLLPAVSWAAMDDDVVEQADRAHEIKSAVREKSGTWLPVPIPMSNPTIGTGLQAALLYLHPSNSDDPTVPGATSGIIGMYTDSESWLAGGFHDGNFNDDMYRYRITAGRGEFNLDFYGIGGDSNTNDISVPYSIASDIALGQILRRIPGFEDWYFGFRYMYIKSKVTFDFSNTVPELPPVSDDMMTSSLGFIFSYDSRNNNYYPTSGSYSDVVWMRDDKSTDSDFEFDKLDTFYNYYMPVTAKDTLAFRVTLANADGDTPFYLLPSLRLRGFAAGKYKDNSSFSGHLEWRKKIFPRWGIIAFYEAGSVARTVNTLLQADIISSYGGGIRWQVSKDKKINLGIDVGYSSDGESAVYMQVGEKF